MPLMHAFVTVISNAFACDVALLNMLIKTRSGEESTKGEIDNEDNEGVELEKSNVLLLGPTGSGRIIVFLILYSDVVHYYRLPC